MLLNCGVGEDSWEPLDCKEIQPVHPKGDQSWIFIGKTDAEAETPIFWPPDAKSWLIWKDPDAGKDWGREEKQTTGWDGWMASPTQWTWVWVHSWSWWWTGRPGVLRFMGSQRVGHNWVTELNWGEEVCWEQGVSLVSISPHWLLTSGQNFSEINTFLVFRRQRGETETYLVSTRDFASWWPKYATSRHGPLYDKPYL